MEITVRDLATVLHGMGFGALFMLAFSGALAELYRMSVSDAPVQPSGRGQTLLSVYLVAMVVLAWLTVFSGAYIVYPWYRAVPPPVSQTCPNTLGGYCSPVAKRRSGTTSAWSGKNTCRG